MSSFSKARQMIAFAVNIYTMRKNRDCLHHLCKDSHEHPQKTQKYDRNDI